MENNDIFIVGAGTYGEAMFELAKLNNYSIKAYFDEDDKKLNKEVMGVKVVDKFTNLNDKEINKRNFIVAIGNNKIRYKIMSRINKLGGNTPRLIHPEAYISNTAKIGKGTYIQANATIWTKVKIKNYCIISPNVVIAHHSVVGDACLISTLSGVGASITIEDKAFLGMNSTIVTGMKKIGENSIIGAGAVVLKNVEKNSVYAGVPAEKIRDIE